MKSSIKSQFFFFFFLSTFATCWLILGLNFPTILVKMHHTRVGMLKLVSHLHLHRNTYIKCFLRLVSEEGLGTDNKIMGQPFARWIHGCQQRRRKDQATGIKETWSPYDMFALGQCLHFIIKSHDIDHAYCTHVPVAWAAALAFPVLWTPHGCSQEVRF